MLDSVKRTIDEINDWPSFPQYYTQYVLKTQDNNIEHEFQYLITHNVLDSMLVERLVDQEYRRMLDAES